jgi:hypothetical protein
MRATGTRSLVAGAECACETGGDSQAGAQGPAAQQLMPVPET